MSKLWIIGAAGRQGAAVAEAMSVAKTPMVLVDRDRSALERLCNTIGGGAEMIVTDSMGETIAEVRRGKPSVVANFVGPFTKTALPLIAASGGADYLDLANELPAVQSILALHDEARANGRCIVAGAGFGLLATESLVLKICDDRHPAQSVRVDAIPYLADAGDRLGPAVAETIVELLRYGGRRYNRDNLERVRLGSDSERFALPDGKIVRTGAMPTGDLEAARRASNANTVLSASSAAPHGAAVPVVVPLMASLLTIGFFRDWLKRRLAGTASGDLEGGTHTDSWARAKVAWTDGTLLEAWLRAGDAGLFTTRVASAVALRLYRKERSAGAYTPGALFGPDLAIEAGGVFIQTA